MLNCGSWTRPRRMNAKEKKQKRRKRTLLILKQSLIGRRILVTSKSNLKNRRPLKKEACYRTNGKRKKNTKEKWRDRSLF